MEQLRAEDPQRIGAYRLLGRLGTGGMGRVFLARSERGRTVAVKLVRAELAAQEEFRTRFRREVLAARRVGGTWTAPVLDADTEAGIPWVATGYVAGPSLQQVLKDYGPLPERSVWVLAAGLAHALADIHTAGLVHRDLKPSNVMITIDGPRVIDFGIARALETVADGSATLTYTGAMVGSPAFMSPEQVRGDRVTPACDVFCLGSVLAYAATGLQPFGAASSGVHAQMFRIVQEPPDLHAVPDGLRALVTACLVKEPEERPSLDEVLALIESAEEETPKDTPAGRVEPWLPGAIVAQLGRRAVQLLELEAEAEVEVEAPVPAGAAVAEVAAGAAAGPGGGSGGGSSEGGSVPPGRTGKAPTAGAGQAAVLAAESVPGAGAGQVAPPPPGPGDGTSGAGGPREPAGPRRGRRGALVAVLALLAVTAGATTAYVVVHETGGGGAAAHAAPPATANPPAATSGTPTATPSATSTPSSTPTSAGATATKPTSKPTQTPTPTGAAGTTPATPVTVVAAPAGLVGTWQASYRTPPAIYDNRTLTVRANGSVELSGSRSDGTDTLYKCVWSMSVVSVGPPARLSPSLVTGDSPAGSCQAGTTTTTLTLIDDTHLQRDGVAGEKKPLTYYEKVS
ncbi:serine/threonine-protein kinase [Streptomyces sp. NBC_01198]|uniref:serine/threonine-protein kinase n=1 Tax=Streptomyces sp. NBC_01198 TaxID=2903769 RepID=UPI002E0D6446|nr:serine/threonine protein kinase [Streptomyces sp. NBC_01198]